jgi:hypothetical protein
MLREGRTKGGWVSNYNKVAELMCREELLDID